MRALSLHVAAVMVAVTLGASPAPVAPATPGSVGSSSVVVTAHGDLAQAAAAVAAYGGEVRARIDLIDAVVATVPGGEVDELARDPRVESVTPDYELRVQSESYGSGPRSTYPRSIRATELWGDGITGRGVGVALLDTGVADHPDLAGRVIASADLTTEGTFSDSYGHGTFLAGLIAGDGSSSAGGHIGVAPGANLVSIKAAGGDGATTLGQVLYGLQLIDASKERYDIRVLVMALAAPPHDGPDPLVVAVERLWADGIVVVAAAGNSGPTAGSVTSPAIDPYVITAGATDEVGTKSVEDDLVPDWSARGPSVYGLQKPDMVAPGTSLVSLRAEGSTIDEAHPTARVGDGYFRGSGTSMSAAVTAGAVALMLEEDPGLSPDEVKGALLAAAVPMTETDARATGWGAVDVFAASSIEAAPANGELPTVAGEPVEIPVDPSTKKGHSFAWFSGPGGADRWLGKAWAGKAWASSDWSGKAWANSDWAGKAWAGKAWAGKAWAGKAWAGKAWAGSTWAAMVWR